MGESRTHMDLVSRTYEYIKTIIPKENHWLIQYDSPDSSRPAYVTDNVVPDVYYCYQDMLVIGEAKTIDDFERLHSKKQYDAYVKECLSFKGKSIIVISVPWQLVATAKNYFRRLKQNACLDARIIVINEMGRCFEV